MKYYKATVEFVVGFDDEKQSLRQEILEYLRTVNFPAQIAGKPVKYCSIRPGPIESAIAPARTSPKY